MKRDMGDLDHRLGASGGSIETLEALFEHGRVRATRGAWLDREPAGRCGAWDRVEGMLLGLAIGDALGNTSEGLVPESRRALFGEIRDYPGRAVSLRADLRHRRDGREVRQQPRDPWAAVARGRAGVGGEAARERFWELG